MRVLAPGLQSHLDSGATTVCLCWRMQLASGETLGFTDHDQTLVFEGTTFEAAAGFTGSEIQSSLGLSVDNMEASGALRSTKLDEARLGAGDFDHAAIEVWRVNWQDVAMRVLLRKGHLGEVTIGAGGFNAEVRGLSHLMNQPKGRLYQYGCDAVLGDGRCGVNLANSAFRADGLVAAVEPAALILSGFSFQDEWCTRGTLKFNSGAGTGREVAVKRHRVISGQTRLDFWSDFSFVVLPGVAVTLTAGCDKQFSTCRNKFINAQNFQGFPHMPGTDFVAAFASQSDANNNGGRRT